MSAPRVKLQTTRGDILLKLYPKAAPKACQNFLGHAADGYYDGTLFHRVIPDFMIQGGDPTGAGSGGESIWGEPFEDECDTDLRFSQKGILAMANAGPGTNGSQFFITTAKTPWLNMRHTIFGEVEEGFDVVKEIEQTPADASDRPLEPQKILKASVLED